MLQGLWLGNSPDQARISAIQKDMLSIRAKIQEKATQARFETQAILTPAQQAKILALQQAHQEKIAPLQEELWKKKMELRTLWLNQSPDKTRINELQKEVFGLIDQLQQESMGLRAEMLKVLETK